MTSDQYQYWREELASPGRNRRDAARRDLAGFWRIKTVPTKPDWPLAIWPVEGDSLVAQIGNRQIAEHVMFEGERKTDEDWWDFLGSTWMKAAAVTEADYRQALETGKWPDDGKAARHIDPEPIIAASEPAAGIGHNLPDDPVERAKLELENEREAVEDFLKAPITSQEVADKASEWARKLISMSSRADGERKVEKQPHLDASRAVDAKWADFISIPKGLAARVKRHLEPWLLEQSRLERERQENARKQAAEAQKKAEEAARLAEMEATRSSEDAEEAKAAAEAAAAQAQSAKEEARARPTAAGRTGAKTGLRKWVYAEITDFDALLTAIKDDKQVREYAQKRANAAAEAGNPLPGTKRVETESVYKPEQAA